MSTIEHFRIGLLFIVLIYSVLYFFISWHAFVNTPTKESAMDRVPPRKNRKKQKILLIGCGVLLLDLTSYRAFFRLLFERFQKKKLA